jgi:hypothetical protein
MPPDSLLNQFEAVSVQEPALQRKDSAINYSALGGVVVTGSAVSPNNRENVRQGQNFPPGLRALIEKCWEQKPQDRPADFKSITQDIEQVQKELLRERKLARQGKSSSELTRSNLSQPQTKASSYTDLYTQSDMPILVRNKQNRMRINCWQ